MRWVEGRPREEQECPELRVVRQIPEKPSLTLLRSPDGFSVDCRQHSTQTLQHDGTLATLPVK